MRTPAVVAGTPPAVAEPSGIRWHQCALNATDEEGAVLDRAGAECGDLRVPLDAATRYDLIGLDPRFVGRSTPIDCKLPIAGWPWGGGSTHASFVRGTEVQEDLAKRCTQEARPVLQYINTRNTARDIDQVRIALGEQQISYLGESYGSYLGAVYLQMFPGRTDRVVFDGPVDPSTYGPRLLRPIGAVNEAGLRAWATWAAARNSTYRLGATTSQVLANCGTTSADREWSRYEMPANTSSSATTATPARTGQWSPISSAETSHPTRPASPGSRRSV